MLGSVSRIRTVVEKAEALYQRWLEWISKDRNSDYRPADELYDMLGREDLVSRLISDTFVRFFLGQS